MSFEFFDFSCGTIQPLAQNFAAVLAQAGRAARSGQIDEGQSERQPGRQHRADPRLDHICKDRGCVRRVDGIVDPAYPLSLDTCLAHALFDIFF